MTLSELSAAARSGWGAERCSKDRLGGRAPGLGESNGAGRCDHMVYYIHFLHI